MRIAELLSFSAEELARLAAQDPLLASQIATAIEYEDEQDQRERCEASLIEFFAAAWPQFDPAPVKVNWHHELIAEHLEAVTRGEIRRLLISVPPRCSKTNLVNVCWPAWIWAQPEDRWGALSGPQVRFMCISYGQTLSIDIATTARRLVLGPWYQGHWGKRVVPLDDQSSKENFGTTAGGYRLATSMSGATLGRGGDIKILDDPNSVQQAESDIEREQAIRTYDEALATRETDPSTAAEVIIMQRLHERDIAGHVLDTGGRELVHLMLPMEFDERRCCVTRWGRDPRTQDGELLWPEQFPRKVVEERKRRLGPYAASGQLQQSPVTRGGNIIKREWWRLWPDDYSHAGEVERWFLCDLCGWQASAASLTGIVGDDEVATDCRNCGSTARRRIPFPEFSYRLLSVDTAYGEKQDNSWSAVTAWGIWHDKEDAPRAMLTHAWRGRPRLRGVPGSPNPSERKGLVEQVYAMAVNQRVDTVLIEQKTRGTDLYNELERLTQEWPFALEYFSPVRSKEIRLEACVPLFTNERVWAPDIKWAETVISEVASAPKGRFNDLCDTVSAALINMRDHGLLSLGEEFRRAERRKLVYRGTKERGGTSVREMYEGNW
jgi:phage terminase large subunit-like protein